MRRALVVASLGVFVALMLGSALAWWLPRLIGPHSISPPPPAGAPSSTAKIRATLFYISEDGLQLVGLPREVAFGEGVLAQARLLVEEQLQPPPEPYAQAIPAGTTLRGLFVTPGGDAFVDLSAEARARHTGGSLDELFSVYAVVNALTMNLPAIKRVQILVDGKEVDTLAGHVDLRRPLEKNLKWVTAP
jgi:hypothetical protein